MNTLFLLFQIWLVFSLGAFLLLCFAACLTSPFWSDGRIALNGFHKQRKRLKDNPPDPHIYREVNKFKIAVQYARETIDKGLTLQSRQKVLFVYGMHAVLTVSRDFRACAVYAELQYEVFARALLDALERSAPSIGFELILLTEDGYKKARAVRFTEA